MTKDIGTKGVIGVLGLKAPLKDDEGVKIICTNGSVKKFIKGAIFMKMSNNMFKIIKDKKIIGYYKMEAGEIITIENLYE